MNCSAVQRFDFFLMQRRMHDGKLLRAPFFVEHFRAQVLNFFCARFIAGVFRFAFTLYPRRYGVLETGPAFFH